MTDDEEGMTMNDIREQCADHIEREARKPPAWMKREPMERGAVIEQLVRWAAGNVKLADGTRDPDIAAGLREQAQTQSAAASALNGGTMPSRLIERLRQLRDARLGCARATTEPQARGTYVDAWWTYAEALRYLGGGQ